MVINIISNSIMILFLGVPMERKFDVQYQICIYIH